ncbi:MAG: NAD-dependent deacylase [Anaerolineaceae bacterium]|nr:NAD-dependent deacylase [Anaerolineaceae bacterium]
MSIDSFESKINTAVNLIKSSNNTIVLTGAGISTPSGIPDFRSAGSGLWEIADPMDIISLTTFLQNPVSFFSWLHPFAKKIQQANPNAAHQMLAKLKAEKQITHIITQNIDDLHATAGSIEVIELHGNVKYWECLSGHPIEKNKTIFSNYCESGKPPICPKCSRMLKPAIVLFEEALPKQAWEEAVNAAKQCQLMIVIGSSLVVGPANELPYLALQNRAKLIIITLSDTPIDTYADVVIHEDVETTLSEIGKSLGIQ